MMRWTQLAMLAALGCSAPEVAQPTPTPPGTATGPRAQVSLQGASPADRPPTAADIAAAIEEPAPSNDDIAAADNSAPLVAGAIELLPVDPADLPPPQPPYSGWTLSAPIDLTGPGGGVLTTLERSGVRVEVVGARDDRVNIQCSGCEGDWRDAGAWIAADAIYPAGRPAPADLALAPALSLRAGWAQGENLPEDVDRGTMCRLIDLGYLTTADDGEGMKATWEQDGGRLVLQRAEQTWEVIDLSPPTQSSWRCRVTRSDDTRQGEGASQ